MSYKLSWNTNINVKDNISFLTIGSDPGCSLITQQVKIYLDERFINKNSLVHCCEDLEDVSDDVVLSIDFIVILIDIQGTSQNDVIEMINRIDPRFMLNSRLILVSLMKYTLNLNKKMMFFVDKLGKKYDSICLTGSVEEPKYVTKLAQEITQYACYIFKNKFISVFTNSNNSFNY